MGRIGRSFYRVNRWYDDLEAEQPLGRLLVFMTFVMTILLLNVLIMLNFKLRYNLFAIPVILIIGAIRLIYLGHYLDPPK